MRNTVLTHFVTKLVLALSFLVFILACSTSPENSRPEPDWLAQPARKVDNGYIVYIGTGEEVTAQDAFLAAEGMAIQDLANECSFIPKGARVEDRYSKKLKNTYQAYVKVAIELQVCDEASKITDPAEIKKVASVPFAEELKNYQDRIQDHSDEVADSGIPPEQLENTKAGSAIASPAHFFLVRQYVVYQNQQVILAPATAYAPGSPEAQTYAARVRPVIGHIQSYAAQNPEIKTQPAAWSSMSRQVRAERAASFARPGSHGGRPIRPPQHSGNPAKGAVIPKSRGGRHHRRDERF